MGLSPENAATGEKLGLKPRRFYGRLLGEAKWQAYRDAEIFVLRRTRRIFGISVAEGLGERHPAIVTRARMGWLEERRTGWWIDIGVDALVATFSDALNRPSRELEAMGARGRDDAGGFLLDARRADDDSDLRWCAKGAAAFGYGRFEMGALIFGVGACTGLPSAPAKSIA